MLHVKPNLPPNSFTGLMLAQVAATKVMKAPLVMPKMTSPNTVPVVPMSGVVQSANKAIADPIPPPMKRRHTPNLSARKPDMPRPMKEPALTRPTEYVAREGATPLASANELAKKLAVSNEMQCHIKPLTRV